MKQWKGVLDRAKFQLEELMAVILRTKPVFTVPLSPRLSHLIPGRIKVSPHRLAPDNV